MSILFTNNAATTLASSITNVATSLTVASGQGALFPTISGSDFFYATLANGSGGVEIVKVTARSTDTFTIVRAQDNTSASAWNAGDKVELRVVAADLNAMVQTDNLQVGGSATTGTASSSNYLRGDGAWTTPVTSNVAGTGISVSAATGAVTIANTGVTSATAGTGISVSASTGGITITNTAPATTNGTVTSVATNGGLTGGTITTSGTLSINTNNNFGIGSTQVFWMSQNVTYTAGSTISGSYLFYASAVSGSYDGWIYGATMRNEAIPVNRTSTYVFSPGGGISVTYTPVGGTWRALSLVPRAYNQGCCGPRVNAIICIRTA